MSVNYAILGLLNSRPMSGYDLKKIMQDSLHMYWSGNNNQIYKALVQLRSDDFLTVETHHQDGAPSKKIYHVTDKGRVALDAWICSTPPETPEFKKPFLIQLAGAGRLKPEALEVLVLQYEHQLNTQLKMQQEKRRRANPFPGCTDQEKWIEDMIFDNILTFYQSELEWTRRVLEGLRQKIREE